MAEQQPPTAGGDAETAVHPEYDDEPANKGAVEGVVEVAPRSHGNKSGGDTHKPPKLNLNNVNITAAELPADKQSATEKATLYQEGEDLLKAGQTDEALRCFLASLKGLSDTNTFRELPQCLHQISDIYFSKNEYEKAVYFIQAEKMYYETALLDILAFQQEVADRRKRKEASGEADDDEEHQVPQIPHTGGTIPPEIIKANEFENLANLCLKEGSLQLAIDYCGKATKLFRETYGDDHPRTIRALELFTSIYADVGKQLYEDAMQMYGADGESLSGDPYGASDNTGVRMRKKVTFSEDAQYKEPEPVVTEELEPTPLPQDQDDWMVTILLMVIFFLATLLLALIGSYFYCRDDGITPFCAELKGDLTYWYIRVRHLYLHYIKGEEGV